MKELVNRFLIWDFAKVSESMKSMFHPLKSMQKVQKAWIEHGLRRMTWIRSGLPDSNRVRSRTQPCLARKAYPICLRLSPLRSGCVRSFPFASGYLRCASVGTSAARFVLKIPTLIFTNEHKDTLIASAPTQRSCRLLQYSITPLLLCLLAALTPAPAQAEELIPELPEKHFDFLDKYCLECHDALTEKGSVNLEDLAFVISNIEEAELWQKVLNTMNAGEMPPEDKKQPDEDEKADFLDALAQTMVDARRSLSDTGGEITMRRLNRREYQNSMASLLGFEVDVSTLPADGGGSTFDTEGASLFISSDQIEQYLKLGRSAVGEWLERRAAIGQPAKLFRLEPEKSVNAKSRKMVQNLEAGKDKFLLWKAEVDKVIPAPENREIMARLLKENPDYDPATFPSGGGLRFYRNASELIGAPDPKDFGYVDDNKAVFSYQGGYSRHYAYQKHFTELPHNDRGAYLRLASGIQRFDLQPDPQDLPPGTYKLRILAGTVEGSDPSRHFIEVGHPAYNANGALSDSGFTGPAISSHQVTGTIENPSLIELTIDIGADTPREFGVQESRPRNAKAIMKEYYRFKAENGYGTPPAIWIDWMELEGPDPASHSETTLTGWWVDPQTTPDDSQRAREIFENFAVTAFRGVAAEDDFLDRLSTIYETRRAAGDSFEQALELPLAVILSSPGFIYFNEPVGDPTNDADERRQLNDRELAVRLAYFLWSAPPDEELLSLAQSGELGNPDILRSQVDRLIADPRSDEFIAGFLHQWLDMERLDFFQFDTTLYRDFDESTRSAARQEVYESFAHLLRSDDGNLGQLLKSDHVFVNGLLATYYDLDGVTGDEFQKVSLPAGSPRGGLLGMAAIHAMGSDGIESSPVERGAWVLRHLLNDPPPPAPPNVPQLSRLDDEALTTRQKLAAHMEEAQCASCHRKIDPIGFGLENFNAAGKWRTEEGRGRHVHEIDPADQFHNGPKFKDYFELRDIIAGREPDFARGFTEHLIGYGLGRPFGFTDEDLADEIVEAAAAEDYTVSTFVQALVASDAFGRK